MEVNKWIDSVIKQDEIDRYLMSGKDFIDDELIWMQIKNTRFDKVRFNEILAKSLEIERLQPEETAMLLNIDDDELLEEMYQTAAEVKRRVYDNRIVTFAPLYCSNLCVNNCLYCGFRTDNKKEKRRILSIEEVKKEAESLARIGHKRLIVVYGEHPLSDADYISKTIEAIYSVKVPTKKGYGQIRRVNINAAPMEISKLKMLWEAGSGTFQVFQETYNHEAYKQLQPATIKSN